MHIVYEGGGGYCLDVEEFTFPDGQPHVRVRREGRLTGACRIVSRIRSGDDILRVLLAAEALRTLGANPIWLDVNYLLGARMDRRIGPGEPFTLGIVASLLRGRFDKIRVLDPHSDVACALLGAEPISPIPFIRGTVEKLGWSPEEDVAFVAPDAGAQKRVEGHAQSLGGYRVVQCLKKRDPKTGGLSGFRLADDVKLPERLLIIDDICDGGRTFVEVAKILRSHGAKQVYLYVTHGIFSKGFDISGIDWIFTTNSYRDKSEYPLDRITVIGEV